MPRVSLAKMFAGAVLMPAETSLVSPFALTATTFSFSTIISDARKKFLGASVIKTPIAYPVFLNEYETARKDFEKSTGIENLLSIGRNGEFAHIFMEDVYWRTGRKVRQLLERQTN